MYQNRVQIDPRAPPDSFKSLRLLAGDGRVLGVPGEACPFDRCPPATPLRMTYPGDLRARCRGGQPGAEHHPRRGNRTSAPSGDPGTSGWPDRISHQRGTRLP